VIYDKSMLFFLFCTSASLLYTTPVTIGDLSVFATKHHLKAIWQKVTPLPWQWTTNKYHLYYCWSLPQRHPYKDIFICNM